MKPSRLLVLLAAVSAASAARAQAPAASEPNPPPEQQPPEQQTHWQARLGYEAQPYSFTSTGHAVGLGLSYGERDFEAHGFAGYTRKFGGQTVNYGAGASYTWKARAVLALEAEFAPRQDVLPRQGLTLSAGWTGWRWLRPSVGYRYADYSAGNLHELNAGLTARLLPTLELTGRYDVGLPRVAGETSVTHSFLLRADALVSERLRFFAGYALRHERFESGNPVDPLAPFRANHLLAGATVEPVARTGVELHVDQEWRDNGARATRLGAAVFQRF